MGRLELTYSYNYGKAAACFPEYPVSGYNYNVVVIASKIKRRTYRAYPYDATAIASGTTVRSCAGFIHRL